jgi:hypothetical protein
LRGYLRVRSGRLALERDFVRDPYQPDVDETEPWLGDWGSGSRSPTLAPSVAGTLFTTLIPIRLRQGARTE